MNTAVQTAKSYDTTTWLLDLENMPPLFDALKAADVSYVSADFVGERDNGDIGILPICDDEYVPVDSGTTAALQCTALDLLGLTTPGWKHGKGSHGTITFDVRTRSITLDITNSRTNRTERHLF